MYRGGVRLTSVLSAALLLSGTIVGLGVAGPASPAIAAHSSPEQGTTEISPDSSGFESPQSSTFVDGEVSAADTVAALALPASLCTPDEQRSSERFWRFGNQAGIDFDTTGTTATPFRAPGTTVEGSTVVTDASGTLQFWSNGQIVFNRDNVAMVNGSGLLGNPSATQTAAAFPLLSQPGKYVVATTSTDVGRGPYGTLTYSIVDMALDGGLGAVVVGQKNLPLGAANSASEALTAIPNSEGTGFWVVTYTNVSPNIIAYEFDGDGYAGTAVVSVLPSNNLNGYGSLNLSADGSQLLALTNGFGQSSGRSLSTLRSLAFDAATGSITQLFEWAGSNASGTHGYTADYSPSGEYVYFSRIFSGGSLYRYTIAGASSAAEIKGSELLVGSTGTTGGQVKRAPDGRMYVANSGTNTLSVVNTPDEATPGLVRGGFPLTAGSASQFGLPQMVTGCLPLDFGDAPDSYGTLLGSGGAVHSLQSGLRLGAEWDSESEGQPTPGADGDDLNGTPDDEDGVQDPISLRTGIPASISVNATNDTASPATLAGWIDLNANGTFDADEVANVEVPAESGAATYRLTWPAQASASQATFARFRLLAGTVDVPSPNGAAAGGEVEDYVVSSASYSVAKSASAASVLPGDTATYTVTVTNTGQESYTADNPATFTDDLSGVLDDATYNEDADNGVTVNGTTLSWSGALAAGTSVTVTYSVTVNDPVTGDGILRNTVMPGEGGECLAAVDCVTETPIQSFSVLKSTTATDVVAGETVPYTITIRNTGGLDYTIDAPASFTDDLSAVLDDADYNDDADNGATYAAPTLSWSGALAVGESVTISYSVTVKPAGTGDSKLANTVVTPPDSGGDCPPGSTNLNCVVHVPGQSYTVSKSASDAFASPGGTVTYTVNVTNTGALAYTAASPASFTDDLSAVLDDAAYNDDASDGATVTGGILTWSGALAIGATESITYSVTVNAPGGGDGTLANTVVPTTRGGDCVAGECTTTTTVAAYSVAKSADLGVVLPGGILTYTVTVTNTGQSAFTAENPASFTDDLAAVLDDAVYNDDADNGATVDGTVLSWSGALPVGEAVTITYSVTVYTLGTGDDVLLNTVTTPPGTGGACIVCLTSTPVASFKVVKTTDATDVIPGETVTYTVTVTNTGAVDYTDENPASFTDDLSRVLDDATYNNDADNGATYEAPTLSWSAPLAVDESVTITYSVTVNTPDDGDHVLVNTVVTPDGTGGDCPDASTNSECTSSVPGPALHLVKTQSVDTVIAGGVVTYTVTVANIGGGDFTEAKPASFTDDLSRVLDDAVYNGDATEGATVDGTALTWSGALASGETKTITYSVTVDNPVSGDHSLVNSVATPPTVTSNCATGSSDPDCFTVGSIASFTTTKVADTVSAAPGQVVTYSITVSNTGRVPFTAEAPAAFTDDLSAVLDDASYNGDASNGATLEQATLAWGGPLEIGESTVVTYSVTVNSPATGDRVLANTVAPDASKGGACSEASDCVTNTPVSSEHGCQNGSVEPGCSPDTPINAETPPLAHTGFESGAWALLAVLLLSGGLLLIGAKRRRSANTTR